MPETDSDVNGAKQIFEAQVAVYGEMHGSIADDTDHDTTQAHIHGWAPMAVLEIASGYAGCGKYRWRTFACVSCPMKVCRQCAEAD